MKEQVWFKARVISSHGRHLNEPGCAVKASVEKGEIDPDRYAFYKELAEKAIAAEKNNY